MHLCECFCRCLSVTSCCDRLLLSQHGIPNFELIDIVNSFGPLSLFAWQWSALHAMCMMSIGQSVCGIGSGNGTCYLHAQTDPDHNILRGKRSTFALRLPSTAHLLHYLSICRACCLWLLYRCVVLSSDTDVHRPHGRDGERSRRLRIPASFFTFRQLGLYGTVHDTLQKCSAQP